MPVMTGVNGWGVVKSLDGGITWSERLPQFRLTTPLTWVVVDPRNPSDVYAGDIFNFIHKSTNAGATFQRIKLESTIGTVNSLVVETSGSLYAATSRGGVLRSLNGGLDWASYNCGLPHLATTQMVISQDGRFLHLGTRWGGVFSYELPANGQSSTCTEVGPVCVGAGGRFCVRVAWRTPNGRSGFGQPVPLTQDTGSFWFFDASNLELMIKLLDGRQINGKFWVFYGSLSNIEYEITVTDNETGRTKTYTNPQGQVASVTDTEAF